MTHDTDPQAANPPESFAMFEPRSPARRPGLLALMWSDCREFLALAWSVVRDWFVFRDDVELTIGDWCPYCRDVVLEGHNCPRALSGFCVSCERNRPLDYYGNCDTCGSTSVTDRHCERRAGV